MKKKERDKIVHAKEDILSPEEILLMISTSKQVLRYEFVIKSILFGGMRAGEIAHLTRDWWAKDEKKIEIPTKQSCSCRECRLKQFSIDIRKEWEQDHPGVSFRVSRVDKSIREEKKYREPFSKVVVGFWEPKTFAGIRSIPIVYDEFEEILERFFERYEKVGLTRQRVWQIVTSVAIAAKVKTDVRDVYPHCIRATCASLWGMKKVAPATMCKIFGWDNVSSANPYITTEEERAEQDLEEHAGNSLW